METRPRLTFRGAAPKDSGYLGVEYEGRVAWVGPFSFRGKPEVHGHRGYLWWLLPAPREAQVSLAVFDLKRFRLGRMDLQVAPSGRVRAGLTRRGLTAGRLNEPDRVWTWDDLHRSLPSS